MDIPGRPDHFFLKGNGGEVESESGGEEVRGGTRRKGKWGWDVICDMRED